MLMVTDLVSLLCSQAENKPQQTAYIFLERGETEAARLTFLELGCRARAIAAHLQAMKLAGQRALLLYPPGLDYVEAFFACLYGGVVAVPAYPPSRQHLQRLLAVIEDAAPAVVMTTTELKAKLQDRVQEVGLEQEIFWLATNTLESEAAVRWQKPALTATSQIPANGFHYGLLRYLAPPGALSEELKKRPSAPLIFNYLGQIDQVFSKRSPFVLAEERIRRGTHPEWIRPYEMALDTYVMGGRLHLAWGYSGERYQQATIEGLGQGFMRALKELTPPPMGSAVDGVWQS
jgi:non-ribosomal peptide synthase protein (TIGR01720 family)